MAGSSWSTLDGQTHKKAAHLNVLSKFLNCLLDFIPRLLNPPFDLDQRILDITACFWVQLPLGWGRHNRRCGQRNDTESRDESVQTHGGACGMDWGGGKR